MIRKEGNAILSEPSLNIKLFLDEEKRFYEKSSSFPNQNEFTKIQGIRCFRPNGKEGLMVFSPSQ